MSVINKCKILAKRCSNLVTAFYVSTVSIIIMLSVLTKPTRITKNSATLIDHIPSDNINIGSDHIQGMLCCSISDHYGIFHVTGASCVNTTEENPIMIRNMSSKNIQKFISENNTIDWSCVTEIDDTQLAFTKFHEIIVEKYNCCFPFK